MIRLYMGDLTHDYITVSIDRVPLNVGYIAAYLQKALPDEFEVTLFKSPKKLLQAIKEAPPEILALSNYCWNAELSNTFFKLMKARHPKCLTIMGGSNYPNEAPEQDRFLRMREFLDFYVYQESELGFAELMKTYLDCSGSIEKMKGLTIGGCHHKRPDTGELVRGKTIVRIKELDSLPSPYLTGLLDQFFAEDNLQPMMQTNRGCPFTCTFCHEGEREYFSKVNFFSTERVVAEVEYIAKRAQEQKALAIVDSNFAMYKQDIETCKSLRQAQDKYGFPTHIHTATGKNKPEQVMSTLSILKEGTFRMTASVQSMEKDVLEKVARDNIPYEYYLDVQDRLHKRDDSYRSVSEVIVPLPGETKETFFTGVKKLIEAKIDRILPYTLMMLEGTELSNTRSREINQYTTKFRILPRSVGEYDGYKCIETEEVGVATKDMPFEDYIECRRLSLYVYLSYNSRAFHELVKYLKESGVDIYEWILAGLQEVESIPVIKKIFADFIEETKIELWDSNEELQEHFSKEENFKKLVEGELGSNLLQKYWVQGYVYNFNVLADHYFKVARDVIKANDPDKTPEELARIQTELDNIKRYVLAKRCDIFKKDNEFDGKVFRFEFDVKSWETEKTKQLQDFRLQGNDISYTAELSTDNKNKLGMMYKRYGTNIQAIGKIGTRIGVDGFHRSLS